MRPSVPYAAKQGRGRAGAARGALPHRASRSRSSGPRRPTARAGRCGRSASTARGCTASARASRSSRSATAERRTTSSTSTTPQPASSERSAGNGCIGQTYHLVHPQHTTWEQYHAGTDARRRARGRAGRRAGGCAARDRSAAIPLRDERLRPQHALQRGEGAARHPRVLAARLARRRTGRDGRVHRRPWSGQRMPTTSRIGSSLPSAAWSGRWRDERSRATFVNPVLAGDRPDPAIIKVGDEYWMTYSSFESAPGLPLYRSHDLVNWTFECSALEEPLGSTFAVDIAEVDGHFFIYIPFIPAPWSALTDAVDLRHPRSVDERPVVGARSISASAAPSTPGTSSARTAGATCSSAASAGSRWPTTACRRSASSSRCTTDGATPTTGSPRRTRSKVRSSSGARQQAGGLGRSPEGGWFYLVSAVGGTAGPPTGHMVIVARSRSVHGPWQNHPHNPIARTRGCRRALVVARSRHDRSRAAVPDEWWMLSHGYENGFRTLGRQILLEPIRVDG